jgi:hypothetical protein
MAEDELSALLTRKLMREADNLDIPLPPHPQFKHDDPDSYGNEFWYLNHRTGGFGLRLKGGLVNAFYLTRRSPSCPKGVSKI